jgi:hypothetical protein
VVQAVLGGARAPQLAEPVDRHALLGAPRLQRRDLRGRGGASAALGHVLHDLRAAWGEVLDDVARHAVHVRSPAVYRLPLDPQTLRQLATQNRLVEVAGGLRVPVQMPRVKRRPAPVGTLRQIPDHDMRVEQRIAGARRAMHERGRSESAAADSHDAAGAGAGANDLQVDLKVLGRNYDRDPPRCSRTKPPHTRRWC